MKRLLALFVILALVGSVSQAELRTWKSSSGRFSVEAELLGLKDGKARLNKKDGSVVEVPLSSLSEEDRRYVKDRLHDIEEEKAEEPDEPIAGKIDKSEISMKLVRLDLPKPTNRRGHLSAATYYLNQAAPQCVFVNLGKSDDNRFQSAIKREPRYSAAKPVRGVATLGSREYGFAFDSVGGKTAAYNRLYFDLNGNGDLTDDKPVAAVTTNVMGPEILQSQFPRVNITLDAKDQSIDYSFVPSMVCQGRGGNSYATVMFYAGAVREGFITQGKKRIRLVLVDRNSNGLFDDLTSCRSNGTVAEGDLLLINPNPKKSFRDTLGNDRNLVNKTVCIGKEYYRMAVSPSGDSLKLTPTTFSMGYVTNSSLRYSAMLFCEDYGVVAIQGTRDQELSVPEGDWKVLSYSIEASSSRMRLWATFDGKSLVTTVKKGQAAKLPFGAPYHAVVTATRSAADKVSLSLSVVGSAGERCTNLTLGGGRPPKPTFVVKDKQGKTVHQGEFEYG